MRRIPCLILLLLCLAPAATAAREAVPVAEDPALEARLTELAGELRCVVCQNESLAESRAALAVDLRAEVREMMRAGMSDEAVVESLVARYGDFILYRPPVKPLTWALWAGPGLFVLLGAALALAAVRRRRGLPPDDGLDPADLRCSEALLESGQIDDLPRRLSGNEENRPT